MNTGGKKILLTNNTGTTEYPHIESWDLILLSHPASSQKRPETLKLLKKILGLGLKCRFRWGLSE